MVIDMLTHEEIMKLLREGALSYFEIGKYPDFNKYYVKIRGREVVGLSPEMINSLEDTDFVKWLSDYMRAIRLSQTAHDNLILRENRVLKDEVDALKEEIEDMKKTPVCPYKKNDEAFDKVAEAHTRLFRLWSPLPNPSEGVIILPVEECRDLIALLFETKRLLK